MNIEEQEGKKMEKVFSCKYQVQYASGKEEYKLILFQFNEKMFVPRLYRMESYIFSISRWSIDEPHVKIKSPTIVEVPLGGKRCITAHNPQEALECFERIFDEITVKRLSLKKENHVITLLHHEYGMDFLNEDNRRIEVYESKKGGSYSADIYIDIFISSELDERGYKRGEVCCVEILLKLRSYLSKKGESLDEFLRCIEIRMISDIEIYRRKYGYKGKIKYGISPLPKKKVLQQKQGGSYLYAKVDGIERFILRRQFEYVLPIPPSMDDYIQYVEIFQSESDRKTFYNRIFIREKLFVLRKERVKKKSARLLVLNDIACPAENLSTYQAPSIGAAVQSVEKQMRKYIADLKKINSKN